MKKILLLSVRDFLDEGGGGGLNFICLALLVDGFRELISLHYIPLTFSYLFRLN